MTSNNLMDGVRSLLAGDAGFALLYFAGHGVPVDDVVLVTSAGQGETPRVLSPRC
ncbi:hypothetical protein [Amycolatopsis sp. DSM 110486]|uniref:hypothetical protein n=1 Tax=Amycolatopsis sp. DSM 110486 TaxID=2865832 RepID=UPI001C6A698C|nr:hypothetical protein [Amycolatopsis sp. DSM 110486]QYN18862.1 hypothetical protein K1T34_40130 [Amycolatopsis sp. DSM 110486]